METVLEILGLLAVPALIASILLGYMRKPAKNEGHAGSKIADDESAREDGTEKDETDPELR